MAKSRSVGNAHQQEIDPVGQSESWGRALRVITAYGVGGFLLAFVIPEGLLTRASTLSTLVDAFSTLVPSVNRLSRVSAFPDALRLYWTVMLFAQPFVTVAAWMHLPKTTRAFESLRQMILVWICVAFLMLLFVYFPIVGRDVGPQDVTMLEGRGKAFFTLATQYRLGLAVIGSLFCWGMSVFQLMLLKVLARTYLTVAKP